MRRVLAHDRFEFSEVNFSYKDMILTFDRFDREHLETRYSHSVTYTRSTVSARIARRSLRTFPMLHFSKLLVMRCGLHRVTPLIILNAHKHDLGLLSFEPESSCRQLLGS